MLSIFSSSGRLPADEDTILFVETLFQQFGLEFRNDFQKKRGFLLPIMEHFNFGNIREEYQLKGLVRQMAELFFMDPDLVTIELFYNSNFKEHANNAEGIQTSKPTIVSEIARHNGEEILELKINSEMLQFPSKVVYLIANQLSGYLLRKKRLDVDKSDHQFLPDLLSIYFGFGVFVENVRLVRSGWQTSKLGVLPIQMISGANCLYCYLFECNDKVVESFLSTTPKGIFRKGVTFFKRNGQLHLQEKYVKKLLWISGVSKYPIDFESNELRAIAMLAQKPNDYHLFHQLGYAQLCLGKYEKAIESFDKVLELNKGHVFAYNNRGYAKLLIGKLAEAKQDLDHSFRMKSDNAFCWRNLGVYDLLTGNPQEALKKFLKAIEINSETELIHFYLGTTYLALEQEEKAKEEFRISKSLPEVPFPIYPEKY